jgi:hypothetical protein
MKNKRYSFREMEHIAVNYAISCLKGYDGTFRDYMKGVKEDWREWLKKEDKRKKVVVEDIKIEPVKVSETSPSGWQLDEYHPPKPKEFYKNYVSNGCDCLQMSCPICHG